jgi:hypothetical protein
MRALCVQYILALIYRLPLSQQELYQADHEHYETRQHTVFISAPKTNPAL